MVRLGHHVGDLRPTKPILERELVGRSAHDGCLHRITRRRHVAEDGTSDGRLLLATPPSTVKRNQ